MKRSAKSTHCLAQLLDQCHGLALQPTLKPAKIIKEVNPKAPSELQLQGGSSIRTSR